MRSAPLITAVMVLVTALSAAAGPAIPTAKPTDPAFSGFDAAVLDFMDARSIHAATLAVSYRGAVVWDQGYGTMTRGGADVVPEDAMFRLASVTKPMVAAAARKLIASGELLAEDRAFCVVGTLVSPPYRCHLTVAPPPGAVTDARMGLITIEHLIDHRGGWDRDASGDPMFQSFAIASELRMPSPPEATDIVRYMVGQPLDFKPGVRTEYSNFGYVVLGLIIEQVTGRDLVEHLRTDVYAHPLEGVAGRTVPRDIELGRTLPALRNAREPAYNCDGGWTTRSVFDRSTWVCWADGGWYLEAMEGNGGLIASAPTVAWFLDHYWLDGRERPQGELPTVITTGYSYWFYGSLDGTWTLARQHPNGINYVALFNQRCCGGDYTAILGALDAAATSYKPLTGV